MRCIYAPMTKSTRISAQLKTTLLVSRYAKTAVLSFFRATAPQNHAITLNNPFSSSPFSCAPACERARIGVPPRRPT